MKKFPFIVVTTLAFLFSGCGFLTFHPIFTPKDLIVDNRLPGKWQNEEGYNEFEPATMAAISEIPEKLRPYVNRFYLHTHRSDDGTVDSRNLAFLVKIGNNYFMDLYPLQTEKEKKMDEFFSSHELKLHRIIKVEFKNGNLKLIDFKDNYVENLIKSRQVRIRHSFVSETTEDEQNKMVITASTAELQAFLLKYGDRDEAFENSESKKAYHKIN